ncbi:MAG: hypothetical protein PSV13_17680, partial [Lacunisphaera sp.]|nr:hypothetical protein [Lacunisphaera sp.]
LAGSDVTMTGAGLVTVRATQSGDTTYAAAASVDRSFTVTAAGFASWQTGKFTAGERADPAVSGPNAVFGQDGLPNLVKYALGLEPKQNITTGLPEVGTLGSDWTYTFTRPDTVTDVTCTVEVSFDLVSWNANGVSLALVSNTGGLDHWRASYPLTGTPRIFFRLQVTRP